MGKVSRPTYNVTTRDQHKTAIGSSRWQNGTWVDLECIVLDKFKEESVAQEFIAGLYHSKKAHLNDTAGNEGWSDITMAKPHETAAVIKNAVKPAGDNRLLKGGADKLHSIQTTYKWALRIRLGNYPPAKLAPICVEAKPDSVPVVCRPRRYPVRH